MKSLCGIKTYPLAPLNCRAWHLKMSRRVADFIEETSLDRLKGAFRLEVLDPAILGSSAVTDTGPGAVRSKLILSAG